MRSGEGEEGETESEVGEAGARDLSLQSDSGVAAAEVCVSSACLLLPLLLGRRLEGVSSLVGGEVDAGEVGEEACVS